MDTLPHEAQLALTSFLIALAIGGPVALIGAGNTIIAVRWVGTFMVRRRFTTGVLVSLLGSAGLFGSSLLDPSNELIASVMSGLFA
ncbi:hypothetical protein AWH62_05895 [Maricaulis sp. W15]|uniref:hypothetical protein n=1 Tax=Maricaulis sp. W15 TaxID=1772333 RepID=UPI000948EB56|nr:hypothetical protein [Maricaulis sp. W15]OLF75353.1 hypothetical protein AWH62_05895 [Maricaulis sp. W15]